MRKFGTNKKNPNPPWPYQQSVVVIPPGSSPGAVGMADSILHKSEAQNKEEPGMSSVDVDEKVSFEEDERGVRRDPIMGEMWGERLMQPLGRDISKTPFPSKNCENTSVTGFLCDQTGKYVKLEFLFGENTHMEKIGILRSVGKDFVAIQENGTNNIIVCGTNKIKFINIYEFGME